MPSGAKKRKAAKKKKELEATINPSANSSQGNDDVKSQDDKGSDSGEVGSPASQNHPSHNNPFGEGNKELQESSPSVAGVLGNVETSQKAGLENISIIESQRDWKFEDASERKNGCIQDESVKGSDDDDRSSTSSDDESLDTMKKSEVYDPFSKSEAETYCNRLDEFASIKANNVDEKVLAGETIDLSVPTASIVCSVTPEFSASEETISVSEGAALENTAIPDMITSEKLETSLPTTDGVTFVPVAAPMDLSPKPNEDRVLNLSGESVKGFSGALESASENYGQQISRPLDVGVTDTSIFVAHVKDSENPEDHSKSESEDQPLIASGPQVVQRTSWLSCCGLCDVLTGSNR